jgi:hypothetical protein
VLDYQRFRTLTSSSQEDNARLVQLMEQSGFNFEGFAERSPEAIAARLKQRAEMLRTWKADLNELIQ